MTSSDTVEISDNEVDRFYELRLNGESVGLLIYEPAGTRRALTHTTIQEPYRGRGLGTRLMRYALEDIRARHLTITNYCPVVDRFIEANPQYIDLIDPVFPGSWPDRKSAQPR